MNENISLDAKSLMKDFNKQLLHDNTTPLVHFKRKIDNIFSPHGSEKEQSINRCYKQQLGEIVRKHQKRKNDNEFLLFLHGIKPAIMFWTYFGLHYLKEMEQFTTDNPINFVQSKYLLDTQYAYYLFEENRSIIFFQTKEQKEKFQKQYETLQIEKVDNRPSILLFGKTLGFPESAATFFANRTSRTTEDVSVDYHGIRFLTHSTLLEENMEWLHQRYDISKHLQSEIQIRHIYREKTQF